MYIYGNLMENTSSDSFAISSGFDESGDSSDGELKTSSGRS